MEPVGADADEHVAGGYVPRDRRTAALERVDVIRSGRVVSSLKAAGDELLSGTLTLENLTAGEFVYVRVVQIDDGAAWSTPIYITR